MPTPPSNLSFETTDGTAGGALNWVRTSVSSASGVGTYLDDLTGYRRRSELFNWVSVGYRFSGRVGGDLVAGNREGFESGWVDGYITVQVPGNLVRGVYSLVASPPNGLQAEGFEVGWGCDGYQSARAPGDVTAGLYDGALAYEGFEGWLTGYRTTRLGGDVTAGVYSGGDAAEKFRAVWDASVSIVVVPGYDILCPVHTPAIDDVILFTPDAPGDLAPLASGTSYHVVSSNPGLYFRVSATQGGAPISITAAGNGTIKADPAWGWGGVLG